jgi:hypothetical protein
MNFFKWIRLQGSFFLATFQLHNGEFNLCIESNMVHIYLQVMDGFKEIICIKNKGLEVCMKTELN